MQYVLCLLTSLVFAVHALLGCGIHRTCEHRTAILAGQPETHADHDCATHHDGHAEAPVDREDGSPEPCAHSVCSYVKADTQHIDVPNDVIALSAAPAPVDAGQLNAMTAVGAEAVCRADLSSTQLYVWHCALII